MDIREVAARLEVSERTARRYIATGALRGVKDEGRWSFSEEDVQAFLASTESVHNAAQPAHLMPQAAGGSAWERYREFVVRTLQARNPANVIVLDRKGAKAFEWLSPPTYRWGENVWHDSVLRCLPSSALAEMCAAGPLYVFDEMVQHARAFAEIRDLLEPLNGDVGTYALVGRRSLREAGQVADTSVEVCDDLDDREFPRAVSKVASMLNSGSLPLDVDHPIIGGSIPGGVSADMVVARLFPFGDVGVVPNDDVLGRPTTSVTLDRPRFFDTSQLSAWPRARVEWSGPCKLRFYFDWDARKYAVASVAFPRVEIASSAVGQILDAACNHPWLGNIATQLEEMEHQRIAELFYRVYALDAACQLLRQSNDVGLFAAAGLQTPDTSRQLDQASFVATLGPMVGPQAFECANRVLCGGDAGQQKLPFPKQPALVQPLAAPDACLDDTRTLAQSIDEHRDRILETLEPTRTAQEPEGALPWNIVVQEASAAGSLVSASLAVDWLLDQGPVKPLVLVRDTAECLVLERGLRRGEFGTYFEHQSTVLCEHDHGIRSTLALSAVATDRMRKAEKGIGSMAFAKTMVNLQHDWDHERLGGTLFAGWVPYLHGPVPIIPIVKPPGGGYFQLEEYALSQGYLHRVETGRGPGHRLETVPLSELDWLSEYQQSFDPYQRNYLEALLDCYARIQESIPSTMGASGDADPPMDPLVVLAAMRNQGVAYTCGYGDIGLWSQRVLQSSLPLGRQLRMDRPSPKIIDKHLKYIAEPVGVLRSKLDRYATIHEYKRRLVRLAEETGSPIMEKLAADVDPAPIFDMRPPAPIGALQRAQEVAADLTSLVRRRLSGCGLASDSRTASQKITRDGVEKNAAYYWRRLIKNAPELRRMANDLEALCSSEGRPAEAEVRTIEKALQHLRLALMDEAVLPNPLAAAHAKEASQYFASFLHVVRSVIPDHPCALLVVDGGEVVRTARRMSGPDAPSASPHVERLLEGLEQRIVRLGDAFGASIKRRIMETFVLTFRDADSLLRAAKLIQEEAVTTLSDLELDKLSAAAPLRFGADWHEPQREPWMSSDACVVAYALSAESRIAAGEMLVTGELRDHLEEPPLAAFEPFTSANTHGIPRAGIYRTRLI